MSLLPLHRAAVLLLAGIVALPAWAQILQEPPTALTDGACVRQVPEAPVLVVPPPVFDGAPAGVEVPAEPDPDIPRDTRKGMFQKLTFDAAWLAPDGSGGLGMTDLETRCRLGLPAPTREWPMLVTPGFAMHWLNVPRGIDLPSSVYDANIQFRWLPRISEQLLLNLSATPGVYRDFNSNTTGGVRTTVDVAGVWIVSPRNKFILGASYRDRLETNWIPLAGWLWRPTPEFRADLLFPEPKVQQRVYWFGHYGDDVEDWLYVSGEWADSVWAYTRANGAADRFAYRDLRLLLGLQRDTFGGLDWRVEVGYVFSRRIQTQSGVTDYDPSGTVILRAGVQY